MRSGRAGSREPGGAEHGRAWRRASGADLVRGLIVLLLAVGTVAPLGGQGPLGGGVLTRAGAQEPPVGTAATPSAATPAASSAPLTASAPQPSFDGIRLERDGTVLPYSVWFRWPPLLVTTPDGGAWAFFTAQAQRAGGPDALRLYAARFDPARGIWLPATALGGGNVQFGPAAAVDRAGAVHLVYSDRADDAAGAYSTLLYTRTNAAGGWETPAPVAPDPNAGHQMMPTAAFDQAGQLHVMWRDQRNATPEQRALSPAFGDVFASDLTNGTWNDPVLVNDRSNSAAFAAWPQIVADGERLIAVWSAYQGTTPEELDAPATRVEWSSRPLADTTAWAPPAPVIEREDGEVGGTLVDLAADPRGGVALVYSRAFRNGDPALTDVFLRRLPAGDAAWGPHLKLISGDLGYFPSMAVAADGTTFIGFNYGRDRQVEVGALILRSGAERVSPLYVPTAGEEGEQGRPALAAAADGRLWLLYMHAAPDNPSIELRATRGVELPG